MRRLWIAFVTVMVFSFLAGSELEFFQEMPPLPDRVITTGGTTVIDTGEILAGQNA